MFWVEGRKAMAVLSTITGADSFPSPIGRAMRLAGPLPCQCRFQTGRLPHVGAQPPYWSLTPSTHRQLAPAREATAIPGGPGAGAGPTAWLA